jgi:DNA-binding ferritin-like protein
MKDFNEFQKVNEAEEDSIKSVDDATGPDFKEPETKEEEEKEETSDEESSEESEESNDELSHVHRSLTTLMTSRDQTHYFHLQTESYAEHKALNKYYDKLVDMTDELLEVAQGEYGRVKGKIEITLEDYSEGAVIKHLDETLECIRECRENIDNDGVENVYDDIESLILKTKYLLTLK